MSQNQIRTGVLDERSQNFADQTRRTSIYDRVNNKPYYKSPMRIQSVTLNDTSKRSTGSSKQAVRLYSKGINVISSRPSSTQKTIAIQTQRNRQDKIKQSQTTIRPFSSNSQYQSSQSMLKIQFDKIHRRYQQLMNEQMKNQHNYFCVQIDRLREIIKQNQIKLQMQTMQINQMQQKIIKKQRKRQDKLELIEKSLSSFEDYQQKCYQYAFNRIIDIETKVDYVVKEIQKINYSKINQLVAQFRQVSFSILSKQILNYTIFKTEYLEQLQQKYYEFQQLQIKCQQLERYHQIKSLSINSEVFREHIQFFYAHLKQWGDDFHTRITTLKLPEHNYIIEQFNRKILTLNNLVYSMQVQKQKLVMIYEEEQQKAKITISELSSLINQMQRDQLNQSRTYELCEENLQKQRQQIIESYQNSIKQVKSKLIQQKEKSNQMLQVVQQKIQEIKVLKSKVIDRETKIQQVNEKFFELTKKYKQQSERNHRNNEQQKKQHKNQIQKLKKDINQLSQTNRKLSYELSQVMSSRQSTQQELKFQKISLESKLNDSIINKTRTILELTQSIQSLQQQKVNLQKKLALRENQNIKLQEIIQKQNQRADQISNQLEQLSKYNQKAKNSKNQLLQQCNELKQKNNQLVQIQKQIENKILDNNQNNSQLHKTIKQLQNNIFQKNECIQTLKSKLSQLNQINESYANDINILRLANQQLEKQKLKQIKSSHQKVQTQIQRQFGYYSQICIQIKQKQNRQSNRIVEEVIKIEEIQLIKKQNIKLRGQCQTFCAKFENVKRQIQTLLQENKQTKLENQHLQQSINEYVGTFEQQSAAFQNTITKLQNENKKLFKANTQLTQQNKQLKLLSNNSCILQKSKSIQDNLSMTKSGFKTSNFQNLKYSRKRQLSNDKNKSRQSCHIRLQKLKKAISFSKFACPVLCEVDETGYLKHCTYGTYIMDEDGNLFEFTMSELKSAESQGYIKIK